jgi:hypothetical protein
MKIDHYDFEAVCDALGEAALRELAAWTTRLGLPGNPGTSWTAAPGLVTLAITTAAQNIAVRDGIHLDDATATLLAPGTVKSVTQRCTGPRKNLATWRKGVRTK